MWNRRGGSRSHVRLAGLCQLTIQIALVIGCTAARAENGTGQSDATRWPGLGVTGYHASPAWQHVAVQLVTDAGSTVWIVSLASEEVVWQPPADDTWTWWAGPWLDDETLIVTRSPDELPGAYGVYLDECKAFGGHMEPAAVDGLWAEDRYQLRQGTDGRWRLSPLPELSYTYHCFLSRVGLQGRRLGYTVQPYSWMPVRLYLHDLETHGTQLLAETGPATDVYLLAGTSVGARYAELTTYSSKADVDETYSIMDLSTGALTPFGRPAGTVHVPWVSLDASRVAWFREDKPRGVVVQNLRAPQDEPLLFSFRLGDYGSLQWSDTGRRLACGCRRPQRIHTMNLGDGTVRSFRVPDRFGDVLGLRWKDDTTLVCRASGLPSTLQALDTESGQWNELLRLRLGSTQAAPDAAK